jgi:hypothetical protein
LGVNKITPAADSKTILGRLWQLHEKDGMCGA